MKCNIKECYWNMWSPYHEMYNNEESMQCVSEDLAEHYDESDGFKMSPNSENCPGYLSYREFCGTEKVSLNKKG